ncbi:MAG: hypothetical protein MUF49_24780 [Oculatellaceae cyanobacterium Prado106]|nr:hypothetical protein [Oculatellaceae cyanobacterium Prado106]
MKPLIEQGTEQRGDRQGQHPGQQNLQKHPSIGRSCRQPHSKNRTDRIMSLLNLAS